MPKVLLDTNVFIFSIERPLSNSHIRSARYHAELFLKGLPKLEVIDAERIKDKDLPHLPAAEIARVEYIVSYDRDFKIAKTKITVLTPKEFIAKLGLRPFATEY